MKRYPHYWFPLRSQRYPSLMAVLDMDLRSRPYRKGQDIATEEMIKYAISVVDLKGGIVQSMRLLSGTTVAECWEHISSLLCSKDKLWLWIPDAGRLLPTIEFWERLETGKLQLSGKDWRMETDSVPGNKHERGGLCIIEDPPTLILCELPARPGKLLVLDTQNIGLDMIKGDKDCAIRSTEYRAALCACLSTLRENGLGTLRCTAGSQAVSSLRTAYPCRSLHCHTHADATKLERNALYGGRCECFHIGEYQGEIYHLDVRNMYPGICLTLPVPVSLRAYYDTPREAEKAGRANAACCIAHVRIRGQLPTYPIRRGGYTVFPVGSFDTFLAGPELQSAVESGVITRWHAVAEYSCSPVLAPFYGRWLACLRDARGQGNAGLASWIKRVMNALIGKFAEPGRRWIAAPPQAERGPNCTWIGTDPNGEECRYRNIAYYTQREEKHGESYWSIPAVAGFVTSAGRSQLYGYIDISGRDNVLYCDTDSLIVNADGHRYLAQSGAIRESEVGHLRVVGVHTRYVGCGIRHYSLDDTITCAGVRIGEIRSGESRRDYWERERIAREIAAGRRPTGYRQRKAKHRPEEYRHGVVTESGRVTPLRIHDG